MTKLKGFLVFRFLVYAFDGLSTSVCVYVCECER